MMLSRFAAKATGSTAAPAQRCSALLTARTPFLSTGTAATATALQQGFQNQSRYFCQIVNQF